MLQTIGEPFYKMESGQKRKYFNCLCFCGQQSAFRSDTINKRVSCGCKQREPTTKTHGMTKTKEYAAWKNIKDGCFNPKNTKWGIYGAVGITVFKGWIDSFENFYEYIGPCPNVKMSIDRMNPYGNYEPGNVRWATASMQARNRKLYNTNKTGYCGVSCNIDANGVKKWVAASRRLDGTDWIKTFSESVHGAAAREKAIEYRNYMMDCLNDRGAGYTEGHGK